METRGQMDQKPHFTNGKEASQVELSFEQLLKKREEGGAPLGVATRGVRGAESVLGSAGAHEPLPSNNRRSAAFSTWFPTPYPPLNFTN